MNVQHNVDLRTHHTFGLSVRAAAFCTLTDAAQLPQILRRPEYDARTVLWLGGGSNVLFRADYPGLVVHLATQGRRVLLQNTTSALVEAEAGENWHDFVQYTLSLGLSGLENLSLIPGTVGAAPVQNIGAYGVEVKSCIDSVLCFDVTTAQYVRLDAAACCFAYRDSIFKHAGKGRYVIVSVRFALSRTFVPQLHYGDVARVAAELAGGEAVRAQTVAQAVCQIRRSKLPDPNVLGNAGSFFKNPVVSQAAVRDLLAKHPDIPHYPQDDGQVKLAAGWLIEHSGLKGYTLGGAAVHDKQALVLVNKHAATAAEVVALAQHIQHTVQTCFGVMLLPEPIWLPETSAV